MADPITTASPDTLPPRYTKEQLRDYVFRQLGSPTWHVELTSQQVLDCINDALIRYSQWCPRQMIVTVNLVRNKYVYLEGEPMGQGVIQVHFVEPLPTPTAIFYGNLIDPAPLFRVGLDDYDTFLRWRKTWGRVLSVNPDWYWDESRPALFIHNPIERYNCTVFYYDDYQDTQHLNGVGALWVKEYALEKSRYLYGEVLSKFSGAVPGPVQNLTLDQQKRTNAEAKIKELEDKLFGMQRSTPLSID